MSLVATPQDLEFQDLFSRAFPNAPQYVNDYAPAKKGGFGNILGQIGDVISIGAGGEANYRNRQIGQAMQGLLGDNPAAQQAAIQEIMRLDANTGWSVLGGLSKQRADQTRADADMVGAQSRAQVDRDKVDANSLQTILGMMRAANADTWGPLRERALSYAKGRNYSAPFDIPEKYEDGWATRMSEAGMEAKDSATIAGQRETRGIQQQRADTDRRYKEAQVALGGGKLVVDAITKGATQQQTAAKTGVAAANVLKPRNGKSSGASAPSIAPPGSPRPGQRVRNPNNGEVWGDDGNGKWKRFN